LKKTSYSILLVVFGAGLWISLSITAHNAFKKWDGKFASVLRHNLSEAGLSDEDVVFSVNEASMTASGTWATQTIEVKNITPEKVDNLKAALEHAGGRVEKTKDGEKNVLLVRRGNRLYQKIIYTTP
jgi:hypothetical protein